MPIKIHDKLWWVTSEEREGLAYMTYYEDNKAFEKRKSTGMNWAEGYRNQGYDTQEYTCDNTPTSGFTLEGSVSRWSTSNKLFRLKDPRGFIVEIPTSNVTALVQSTDILKGGIISGECVWGREGSNHILLPVGSEPYQQGVKDTKEAKTKKSLPRKNIEKLKIGQKFYESQCCHTLLTYIGVGEYLIKNFKVREGKRSMWSIKTEEEYT